MEEWFHSNWFDVPKIIDRYYNGKYPETDVVNTTSKLVDTFNKYGAKATFFVLGETAEKYPEIIDILRKSKHEIGCHSWHHNKKYETKDFKRDVLKFKDIYPSAQGFRFPNFDYSNEKLKILVEEGFIYDSSIVPCLKIPGWYGNSNAPVKPYDMNLGDGIIIKQFPMTVLPYLRLPGAGGWFLRNASYHWTKNVIRIALKKMNYGMIYIHPWEISDLNPNIKEINNHVFRNTGQITLNNLERLIKKFSGCNFLTISDSLEFTGK